MNEVAILLKNNLPGFSVKNGHIEEELSVYLNVLINENFDLLLNYLYRLDIDEHNIRMCLEAAAEKNAGDILATMIIKRCEEKIESKRKYKHDDPDCKEERW